MSLSMFMRGLASLSEQLIVSKVPAVERDQGRARHVPESCCMCVVYLATTVSIFVEGTSTDEWMVVDPRQGGAWWAAVHHRSKPNGAPCLSWESWLLLLPGMMLI